MESLRPTAPVPAVRSIPHRGSGGRLGVRRIPGGTRLSVVTCHVTSERVGDVGRAAGSTEPQRGGAGIPDRGVRARWIGGRRGERRHLADRSGRGGHHGHVQADGAAAVLVIAVPVAASVAIRRSVGRVGEPHQQRRYEQDQEADGEEPPTALATGPGGPGRTPARRRTGRGTARTAEPSALPPPARDGVCRPRRLVQGQLGRPPRTLTHRDASGIPRCPRPSLWAGAMYHIRILPTPRPPVNWRATRRRRRTLPVKPGPFGPVAASQPRIGYRVEGGAGHPPRQFR